MEAELAVAGIEPVGELQVTRERPWGSVGRIATDRGTLWLKACAPATAFEAGIYAVLGEVAPEQALAPVALDRARGWLLFPDGGAPAPNSAEVLAEAMRGYARLQRAAAPRVDELLAAGVPDMRPQVLPQRFDEALTFVAAELADRLRELRPEIVAGCEQLAGPASLDHNDLHPANVFADGRFVDWGDAVISHPFACLLMPLGYVSGELGRDPTPVLDAYLEAYADQAPRDDLVATARLAVHLAKIARAHTWERALRASAPGDPDAERFRDAPAQALAALWDGPWERVV
jgi:Ser/Thr protein kinase RdoA (MazF antagonist)